MARRIPRERYRVSHRLGELLKTFPEVCFGSYGDMAQTSCCEECSWPTASSCCALRSDTAFVPMPTLPAAPRHWLRVAELLSQAAPASGAPVTVTLCSGSGMLECDGDPGPGCRKH